MNSGGITIAGSASLRAVLAIVFFLMSVLQLEQFASAAGFHDEIGIDIGAEKPVLDVSSHIYHHGDELSADTESDEAGTKLQHRGEKKFADESCEVHCTPLYAVPIFCPVVERIADRCFAPIVAAVLPLGEYTALIRPPRHLN